MSRRLPIIVDELLTKAKQSAILAVEIYNKPTTEFRVQAFVMLMHVAWNSAFLAKFLHDRKRPFYRERDGRTYQRIHGEKKAWELSTCVSEHWKGRTDAISKNIEFFIGLRNKIEHYRDQSALILLTFGECQSLVTNFEDFVVAQFGQRHSLVEALALSLQLSHLRDSTREAAILDSVDPATRGVVRFIQEFRSSLSNDIFSDMRYSLKLYLIPKVMSNSSRESAAIEWVNVDDLPAEERNALDDRVTAIVKQRHVPVKNPGYLKPSDVCARIKGTLGFRVFEPSSHHVRCWKYYKIRPETGSSKPESCVTQHCQWDAAHKDYVYTETWVAHLQVELSKMERYVEIFGRMPEYADGREVTILIEDSE